MIIGQSTTIICPL